VSDWDLALGMDHDTGVLSGVHHKWG